MLSPGHSSHLSPGRSAPTAGPDRLPASYYDQLRKQAQAAAHVPLMGKPKRVYAGLVTDSRGELQPCEVCHLGGRMMKEAIRETEELLKVTEELRRATLELLKEDSEQMGRILAVLEGR